MDLTLDSSDFDSALLACWDDDECDDGTSIVADPSPLHVGASGSIGEGVHLSSRSGNAHSGTAGNRSSAGPLFRLSSFNLSIPNTSKASSNDGESHMESAAGADEKHGYPSVESGFDSVKSDAASTAAGATAAVKEIGSSAQPASAASGSNSSTIPQPLPDPSFLAQIQSIGGSDHQQASTSQTLPQHLLLQQVLPWQAQSSNSNSSGCGMPMYSPIYSLPSTAVSAVAPAPMMSMFGMHASNTSTSQSPGSQQGQNRESGSRSCTNGGDISVKSGSKSSEATTASGSSSSASKTDSSNSVTTSTASTSLPSVSSYLHPQPHGQLHPLAMTSLSNCPPHSVGGNTTAASASQSMITGALGGNGFPIMYHPFMASVPATPSVGTDLATMYPQTPPAQLLHQGRQQGQKGTSGLSSVPEAASSNKDSNSDEQRASDSRSDNPNSSEHNPPPLFLFDAPCELRANFLQSQRMHNIPPSTDSNPYHYGMAVNGFHPQLNAQVNPIRPMTGMSGAAAPPGLPSGTEVKPTDGRHKKKRTGVKERNEREQRRAQKITELIENLRQSMVNGGWKVEMKSKYHTLSTCADYVKHLIKVTKEKEAAVAQAKTDLSIRERKLEEDKALQESRSDPESVTSSLTASSTCSGSGSGNKEQAGSRKKKHKCGDNTEAEPKKTKKVRLSKSSGKGSGDDVTSSADSSSGEEAGSGGPGGKNISLDKMSSSVSDMTDSNRSSSDGTGSGNGKASAGKKSRRSQGGRDAEDDETGASGQPSSSSISSTAAVARGGGSREHQDHHHSDVVIKEKGTKSMRDRKRKHRSKSSLDRDFELDYEEVFVTSNIPQLIATPAGRIVTWNEFFLRATGLKEEEAKRLTIFSIVQADKLSNLFEMVAAALRHSSSKSASVSSSRTTSSDDTTDKEKSPSDKSSKRRKEKRREWDFSAVTLPCVPFPSSENKDETHHPNPLYMTVTLMSDIDPRRNCFHCIFTDSPGTKGKLGSVTPELLAMLFSEATEAKQPSDSTSGSNSKDSDGTPPNKKQRISGSTSESDQTREDTNTNSNT